MHPEPGRSRPRAVLAAAAACFFVSGLAALLYEVVWMRLLGLVFGHTVHAVTTVLAAYMGGLALGSWLAGRRADRLARPLRAYALLEAGIGLVCAATPLLFRATEAIYLPLHRALAPGATGAGLLHLALAAVVLLPPTTLMGATLPILGRAVVDDARLAGARVGTLYAVNTWGAVAGTALTGFLLLPTLGLARTVWLGVALNLAVAALALSLERVLGLRAGAAPAPTPTPTATSTTPLARGPVVAALVAIGISGAASMAYQVAWTRTLGMVLGSSTYAFTAMLTTFLVGLALGALLVSRLLARRPAGLAAFGLLEVAIAVLALAILPLFGRVPDALLWLLGRTGVSHGAALGAQFGLTFLLVIGPTLAIGATFPLVVAAIGTSLGRVGRDVGVVYGANTLGTIAGSVLAGFVLVPAIGIQWTVRAAAAANVAAGLAVLLAAPPRRLPVRAAAAAAVVLAGLLGALAPRWDPKLMTAGVPVYAAGMVADGGAGMRAAQGRRELLLYEEGLSTTVAVSRSATSVSLSVNGKTDASTGRDMSTQLMLGHLGPLFLEAPRRALVIGLASGVTAGAVAQHPFDRVDVAAIEPSMVRAARFFDRENLRVLDEPRVHVLEGDGRQILAAARERYDLVVSEPSNPWIAGVANLFTREFYQAARHQLAPGGVMVQWLQAYSIFGRDMQMVVRTFLEVFPHVTIWRGYPGDLLLLGSEAPLCLDPALVERRATRSPALAAQLEQLGARDDGLALRFVLGDADARRYAAGAPLNTDDLPLLEFSAPRALYVRGVDENVALVRSFRLEDRPCVTGADPAALASPEARLRFAEAALAEGLVEDVALELGRMGPPARLPPPIRSERAHLLLLAGALEEAWQELTFLSVLRPDDVEVSARLAALEALGDPALAARLASARRPLPGGLFADPGAMGETLLQLATGRGEARFLPTAVELLERAVRLEPAKVALLNALAVALAQQGRGAEADALLVRAAAIDPADARTRYNRGAVLQRLGRIPEAAAEFGEAARLRPGWTEARARAAALGAPDLVAR